MTRTWSLYGVGSETIGNRSKSASLLFRSPPSRQITKPTNSQASVIKQLWSELDIWELPLGHLLCQSQEKTITLLHDGGLVNDSNLITTDALRILESISQHPLGGLLGDQLDALDNAVNNVVLDTRVFSLGILSDQNGVDAVVGGLVANDGFARTDVGEEVEGTTEGEVEGNMTLADRSSKRTLKGDQVLFYRVDGWLRNGGLSLHEDWSNIDWFPLNWNLDVREV